MTWGNAKWSAIAMAIALSPVGCLTVPDNGQAGTASASACKNVDLCSVLPMAEVNGVLGKSFDDFEPGFETLSGPDVYSDGCIYSKFITDDGGVFGERLYVDRRCYTDKGAASARVASCPLDPAPLADSGLCTKVTGAGEDAYFEDVPNGYSGHEARLNAHGGNFLVTLFDTGIAPGEDVQQGLVELANMVLSR